MMNWTTDKFLSDLYQHAEQERRNLKSTSTSTKAYKEQLLTSIKTSLGMMPQHKTNLQATIIEKKEFPEYYMESVAYTTMDNVHVPVLVLIPKRKQASFPAVLACHGHGNGQYDAIGMSSEGYPLPISNIYHQFAVQLVRKGVLVIIPEIMGFGHRKLEVDESKQNSCASLASRLLMVGRTLTGMRVYEAIRAIDYLQAREDVQHNKIGLFGFSGGALIGAYTAILDKRIHAAVLSGWVNTFEGSILAMQHCIDNYLPSIQLAAEQPELVSLIAPRALFVEAGAQDPIFPLPHTEKAIDYLQQVYKQENCSDQFSYHIHSGKHEISGERSINWLVGKLNS